MSDSSLRTAIARALVEADDDLPSGDPIEGLVVVEPLDAADAVLAIFKDPPAEVVEAYARKLFATEEPDGTDARWDKPQKGHPIGELHWHGYWLDLARSAFAVLIGGEES